VALTSSQPTFQFEAISPRGRPAYVGKAAPFGTVRSPSALAAATVNGIGPHPTPVKATKKLSLSDYKAARMKKTGTSNTITPENSLPYKIESDISIVVRMLS
jgi:hypothetical protein